VSYPLRIKRNPVAPIGQSSRVSKQKTPRMAGFFASSHARIKEPGAKMKSNAN
jgi:hypothetical protein